MASLVEKYQSIYRYFDIFPIPNSKADEVYLKIWALSTLSVVTCFVNDLFKSKLIILKLYS